MYNLSFTSKNYYKLLKNIIIGLFVLSSLQGKTQTQDISAINASFITEHIKLDGNLNENAWKEAIHIDNFIQREQAVGEPATEKTEIAILYDKNNLYIGLWCFQNDPSTIQAKSMQRDFDYKAEDNFKIVISTFNDGRNGYLFITNPNGARADAQVYGPTAIEVNSDWNGVWDAKSSITDKGWFAELVIPFSTFQFKNTDELTWGINFERNITSKNEQLTWQGWNQNYSIYSLAMAGKLTGIKGIEYAKHFEFKPYLLSNYSKERNQKAEFPAKYGFDLNINLSPTLKLNLTTNTDFAQVESDRIFINLTRFDQSYPEKRDFFLEGYNQFSFRMNHSDDLFYTRSIGIENMEPVPILAGARLVGKVGRNNINFLSIQTKKLDTIPTTNNSVFRYKYDIGDQSYIGGIITSKINEDFSNIVVGLDAKFATSKFLGNKNLAIYGGFSKSFDNYKTDKQALGLKFYISYPNDFMDQSLSFMGIYENFNPMLGFMTRTNYENLRYKFLLTPRWFTSLGVNKLLLQPWELDVYRKPGSSIVETFENQTAPFGFKLKSGDSFVFRFKQFYDNLEEEFELIDDIYIPVDKYWMHQKEIEIVTYDARRIKAKSKLRWGDFYTGKIKNYNIEIGINVDKHLNILNTYTYNSIKLPTTSVITHELASKIDYSFNTRLNLVVYSQYNSLDEILFFNFRLHWIPKIGSDLYLVYNHELDEVKRQLNLLKPTISSGAVKFVWRFVF